MRGSRGIVKVRAESNARAYWLATFVFITVASPAFEIVFRSFYRHLTPFYFAVVLFFFYSPHNRFASSRTYELPTWLIVVQLVGWLVAGMTFMSDYVQDGLADACRHFFIFFSLGLFWRLRLNAREKRVILGGAIFGSLYFLVWLLADDPLGRLNPLVFSVLLNRNLTGSTLVGGLFSVFVLYSMTTSKEKKLRSYLLATAVVLGYFILISISRSTLLTGLCSLVLLTITKGKTTALRSILFTVILIGSLVAIELPNYAVNLGLNKREDVAEFSSGRTDIWSTVFQSLPESYYLGIGTYNTKNLRLEATEFVSTEYGKYHETVGSVHNLPLKLLIENGVLGLLGYILFVVGMIRFCYSVRSISWFPLATAMFCVVFTWFHDYTMVPWVIFAVSLPMKERDELLSAARPPLSIRQLMRKPLPSGLRV